MFELFKNIKLAYLSVHQRDCNPIVDEQLEESISELLQCIQ